MNSEKAAKIISVLLGPQIWLPVMIILLVFKTGIVPDNISVVLTGLLILQFIIPVLYIIFALKLKKISAWDLPKREERYLFLLITSISYLASLLLMHRLGTVLTFHLGIIEMTLVMILSLITTVWKISFHTSLNTAGSILINFLFNWQAPWVYLSIPIIFWARYKLKRHNPKQLIAGILISIHIMLSFLSYFRYISLL
ncbi:MAG: hypothetical protein WCV81_05680 [Microgenomates group bacterium]|jgi:hypothetical protein